MSLDAHLLIRKLLQSRSPGNATAGSAAAQRVALEHAAQASRTISIVERFDEARPGISAGNRIDRGNKIIRGVKIVGIKSDNAVSVFGIPSDEKYSYTVECLRAARQMYEGADVYLNHPEYAYTQTGERVPLTEQRRIEDKIGWLENVVVEASGAYGDFHYIETHPFTGQMLELAERNPRKLALSHNARLDPSRPVVKKNGEWVVEEIVTVRSVDLIGDRPGTTTSLFESQGKQMATTATTGKHAAEFGGPGGFPTKTPGDPLAAALPLDPLAGDMSGVNPGVGMGTGNDPVETIKAAYIEVALGHLTNAGDAESMKAQLNTIIDSMFQSVAAVGAAGPTPPVPFEEEVPAEESDEDEEADEEEDEADDAEKKATKKPAFGKKPNPFESAQTPGGTPAMETTTNKPAATKATAPATNDTIAKMLGNIASNLEKLVTRVVALETAGKQAAETVALETKQTKRRTEAVTLLESLGVQRPSIEGSSSLLDGVLCVEDDAQRKLITEALAPTLRMGFMPASQWPTSAGDPRSKPAVESKATDGKAGEANAVAVSDTADDDSIINNMRRGRAA